MIKSVEEIAVEAFKDSQKAQYEQHKLYLAIEKEKMRDFAEEINDLQQKIMILNIKFEDSDRYKSLLEAKIFLFENLEGVFNQA